MLIINWIEKLNRICLKSRIKTFNIDYIDTTATFNQIRYPTVLLLLIALLKPGMITNNRKIEYFYNLSFFKLVA